MWRQVKNKISERRHYTSAAKPPSHRSVFLCLSNCSVPLLAVRSRAIDEETVSADTSMPNVKCFGLVCSQCKQLCFGWTLWWPVLWCVFVLCFSEVLGEAGRGISAGWLIGAVPVHTPAVHW